MTTTHSEERRAKFAEDVAGQKIGAGNASAADGKFRILGLVVMILGVVGTFVSYSNSLALDDNRDIASTQILAIAFLAVTGYALGPLIVQRYLADVDELGATAASLTVAAIVLAPFALYFAPAQTPGAASIVSVVVLGVACSALALILFFYVIHNAGASRAAVVAYINPAVAALLGVVVLREPFGAGLVIGMAMILFGSWLATSGKRESGIEEQPANA